MGGWAHKWCNSHDGSYTQIAVDSGSAIVYTRTVEGLLYLDVCIKFMVFEAFGTMAYR